jgi:hypothetical protein
MSGWTGRSKPPGLATMIRVAEALGKPVELSDGKPRIAPGEEDHPS